MDVETKKYSFLGLEIGRIGWWGSLIAFLATPILVLPYVIWFRAVHNQTLSDNPERWAQFGDYLAGTAGPIIGFASIMVLVATLHSQQSELREQRKLASRQAFEQTFFNWLNSYREAVDRLRVTSSRKEHLSGVLALNASLHDFEDQDKTTYHASMFSVKEQRRTGADAADKETKAKIVSDLSDWWARVYSKHESQLGSLIRTLFTLIRWVDRHPSLSSQEKWDYVAILRARLSSPELSMLFFNGYQIKGRSFTPYAEKYALLDNLPSGQHDFVDSATFSEAEPFSESAFDSNLAKNALSL